MQKHFSQEAKLPIFPLALVDSTTTIAMSFASTPDLFCRSFGPRDPRLRNVGAAESGGGAQCRFPLAFVSLSSFLADLIPNSLQVYIDTEMV